MPSRSILLQFLSGVLAAAALLALGLTLDPARPDTTAPLTLVGASESHLLHAQHYRALPTGARSELTLTLTCAPLPPGRTLLWRLERVYAPTTALSREVLCDNTPHTYTLPVAPERDHPADTAQDVVSSLRSADSAPVKTRFQLRLAGLHRA